MILDNKNILVFGLGISGVSTLKALSKYNCSLTLLDSKEKEEVKDKLEEVKDIEFEGVFAGSVDLEKFDLIIKSPGIPPSNEVLIEAKSLGIKIITDLELGYILAKTKNIIGITGTNGKTSTTSLVGELFTRAKRKTYVCGNIGVGILDTMAKAKEDDIVVIECSSFQLEDTIKFKPKVGVIINITEDHINWHGNFDAYVRSKLKIYREQDEEDFSIINYDDKIIYENTKNLRSKKIYFSQEEKLEKGIYLEGKMIVYNNGSSIEEVLDASKIELFVENAMAAIGIGLALDLSLDLIRQTILDFKALAHRMEYVAEISGVEFYNDSKGTNPDSTISGLKKLDKKVSLIAGGYNKGSDFKELLTYGKDKIENLVLLGETKDLIKREALEVGYEKIYTVDSMEEAVSLAYRSSEKGMAVVLSPACASWGMYKNFEERGDHFKTIVNNIRVDKYEKNKEN